MNPMPSPASPTQPRPGSRDLLDLFPSASLEERREMFETLIRDPSPEIRSQMLRIGATLLPDDRLVEYLRRDDDAVLRNAGLEILKLRGPRAMRLAVDLLDDGDEDVMLQAILILDAAGDPRALEALRRMLHHDDMNLVQAAITAVGNLGGANVLDDLLPFLGHKPWLRLAAVEALGHLRAPAAVEPLANQLTDLMVGDSAAEALSRIGGPEAFLALADHWLRFAAELEPEILGFLAHVAEGLEAPVEVPEGFAESLAPHLAGTDPEAAAASARLALALELAGPREQALTRLAETPQEATTLPSCLRRRRDLMGTLLPRGGVETTWGLLLVARYPESADEETLAAAVESLEPDGLGTLLTALGTILHLDSRRVDRAVLDYAARLPARQLAPLAAALDEAGDRFLRCLDDAPLPSRVQELMLRAEFGEPADSWRAALLELAPRERLELIEALGFRHELLVDLPWKLWLEQDPARYAATAAEVASRNRIYDLIPDLRRCLAEHPRAQIVRALGHLRDAGGVDLLESLPERRPELTAVVLESLGHIGGEPARKILRRYLDAAEGESPLHRPAFRALSRCAVEEDEERFREAASHPDWHVRLAVAEVLGRSGRDENLMALARLASDPVPVVAQQALAYLES